MPQGSCLSYIAFNSQGQYQPFLLFQSWNNSCILRLLSQIGLRLSIYWRLNCTLLLCSNTCHCLSLMFKETSNIIAYECHVSTVKHLSMYLPTNIYWATLWQHIAKHCLYLYGTFHSDRWRSSHPVHES